MINRINKLVLTLLAVSLFALNGQADQFNVEGFEYAAFDLTASKYPRKDKNGQDCALIKVVIPKQGLTFDGNIVGDTQFKSGEYWIYVPQKINFFKIKHPDFSPLTVNLKKITDQPVGPKQTYILTLGVSVKANKEQEDESEQKLTEELAELCNQGYYQKAWDLAWKNQEKAYPQFVIGALYFNGFLQETDYDKALEWYKKAAYQGLPEAQCDLGVFYMNGWGVKQNYDEAIKWFKMAADAGLPFALSNLGMCHYNGFGTPQNIREAKKYYEKAANKGNAIAQFAMGAIYASGQIGDPDFTESAKWLLRAANQGNSDAQGMLGILYLEGEGVEENYDEGVKWLRLSARQGNENAKNCLDELGEAI